MLNFKLVKNNKYFKAYLQLLANNIDTKKETFVSNQHHCIPVCSYKGIIQKIYKQKCSRCILELLGADLDLNNFIVNLKYSDHIKAHFYLALCSKKYWFKKANLYMIPKKHFFKLMFINFKLKKLLKDSHYFNLLDNKHINKAKQTGLKISKNKKINKN